jgi:hypothetical protein
MATTTEHGQLAEANKTRMLVAIRIHGEERELFCVEATEKRDFYVFLQQTHPANGLTPLDRHMSYHSDGRRHWRVKQGRKTLPTPGPVWRQPTRNFRGVELLVHAVVPCGQFQALRPLRKLHKGVVVLDADSVGFRNDVFFARAYLIEPNQEQQIPIPANSGPRLVEFLQTSTPWFAVEVFQESLAGSAIG